MKKAGKLNRKSSQAEDNKSGKEASPTLKGWDDFDLDGLLR